ncbi:integrase [Bosea sp. F3-2]|uniref:integrase n=1 Tax=Bosea sp. F3-2 TaxID=2599640 RepID=UPI0011EF89D7|nr:integrase [Bosea sp. F3-2]QEL21906.1 integrase [Bosea sp. F3-2]
MTPSRPTNRVVEFDEWRDDIVSALGDLTNLASTPWDVVKRIECFPGSKLGDDNIVVPEDWLPAGITRRLSHRTIKLSPLCAVGSPAASAAQWDESLRRSILALWLPRLTSNGIRAYKPSSWLSAVRHLVRAAEWQRRERPHPDGLLWSHLDAADFQAMQAAVSDGRSGRVLISRIVQWLRAAGVRGLLQDAPPRVSASEAKSSGDVKRERSPKGPVLARVQKSEERNFQPFSDDYVTEIILRARWLQENLATQLISCWNEQRGIAARFALRGLGSNDPAVIAARRDALATIEWKDASGHRIDRLPFKIAQKIGVSYQFTDAWPPTTARTVSMMVGTLQALNLCTTAFCTGARAGEIASATDASLVFPHSGTGGARLLAKTFKLEDSLGGAIRDWPLHPVAARALATQRDLAKGVRPEGDRHLWVNHAMAGEKGVGSPLLDLTRLLVAATEHLGLTALAEGSRPHAHRWRHTVGRMVALSVVSAPQVLLDLFGHRDLEMTLRYMLSHPEIAEEAQKIAQETALALAEEAIAEVLVGKAGGPASATLSKGLNDLRMKRGEDVYGAENLQELTEILTFGGKRWELVRPGVICTKTPGQFGPCTQGRGLPDAGSCRTNCEHRLETERTKSQCSATIGALLIELEDALAGDKPMLVANLRGQLIAQLERWADVRQHWLDQSPRARQIWEGRSQ